MYSKGAKFAAQVSGVSGRSYYYIKKVVDYGIPALIKAMDGQLDGIKKIGVYPASIIAEYSPEIQKEILDLMASGKAKTAEKAINILGLRHHGNCDPDRVVQLKAELLEIDKKLTRLMHKRDEICKDLKRCEE